MSRRREEPITSTNGANGIDRFHIEIPEEKLSGLYDRLRLTRLPEPETVEDASQGFKLLELQELLQVWVSTYNWRARESRWNALPQFRTQIDGLNIHFFHVRSKEKGALPLVLTHGWPGSALEFENVIGPLTDPVSYGGDAADAFDVVVPSLPGFGFSDRPATPGWNIERTASAWATLVRRLGYDRYGAHGGDWGAYVTTALALQDTGHLAGIHLTMPIASPLAADREHPSEEERRIIAARDDHLATGWAFAMQMGTRPQTLGYSLVDSPAGLAAWLAEKFIAYSDARPEAGGGLTVEQQLDGICLYWLTETGASSSRWYWEALRSVARTPEQEYAQLVTTPTACSLFPKEPYQTARRWAERRYTDLRYWHELDRGGHFPAWEQPALFVDELRAGFRTMRRG